MEGRRSTRRAMRAGQTTVWSDANAYNEYVGRWSRLAAEEFLKSLARPSGGRWLDVGCGTGGMADSIRRTYAPELVVGADIAEASIAYARARIADARIHFVAAAAEALPVGSGCFDTVVSGLTLNSLRRADLALVAMRRVARAGGTVAAYVWDYAGEMQMIRRFWDAAIALNPDAAALDPGRTDTICHPARLSDLFEKADLTRVETWALDVPVVFRDFDDFWLPFLSGQGLAPAYCMSLPSDERVRLRERLRATLPIAPDGRIHLIARAFAVRAATRLDSKRKRPLT